MNTTHTKTFQDFLNENMNPFAKDMVKKMTMGLAIKEATDEMNEEMTTKGDIVMGSITVTECPCPRQCGSVQIMGYYTAMTFTAEGIEEKEGELLCIIQA